jgi:polar amino acid transport system substrate-binding protein
MLRQVLTPDIGQLTEIAAIGSKSARLYRGLMPNIAPEVVADLAPGGVLRAALNLGNPVLVQGTAAAPAGVTVDISRELARRLGASLEPVTFTAALDSWQALLAGRAGICFLAVEPARAADIAFTAPYVLIEGVYVVPAQSPLTSPADVDSAGVRIGVKQGSAYDLYLSRTLRHATIVRGAEGTALFAAERLEAGAGVREAVTGFVAANPGYRLIDERFMVIPQALGTARTRSPATIAFLHDVIEELKASGFIADALRRSGQTAPVAPPAGQQIR